MLVREGVGIFVREEVVGPFVPEGVVGMFVPEGTESLEGRVEASVPLVLWVGLSGPEVVLGSYWLRLLERRLDPVRVVVCVGQCAEI